MKYYHRRDPLKKPLEFIEEFFWLGEIRWRLVDEQGIYHKDRKGEFIPLCEKNNMKKIKVRVAVAVDQEGEWQANGWGNAEGNTNLKESMNVSREYLIDSGGVENGEHLFYVETEIEIPDVPVIPGKAERAE